MVGAAVGGALLTRHLALVLLVTAVAAIAAEGWKRGRTVAVRHAGIVLLVAWSAVWVVVRALAWPTGGPSGARFDALVASGRADSLLARLVLAVPWPKEWAAGFGYLTVTSTARPAYLLGQSWDGGRWWYFLGALLVKVPLAVIVVLLAGLLGWSQVPRAKRRHALVVLVVPAVALYLAIALQPLNLGLRYAFPSIALWIVATGPIVLLGRLAWRRAGVAVLAATQAAALVVSFPHSIAWSPPPFQPSYRWASDSNVDYGQDSNRVEEWAVGRAPFVSLLLPRGADPPAGSRPLLETPLEDVQGWVAVSATNLTGSDRDQLAWLRAYCPVGTIGGSVLLYRFDAPVDPAPGPVMPAGLCAGETSVRTG